MGCVATIFDPDVALSALDIEFALVRVLESPDR
jgi:hypothetical protein